MKPQDDAERSRRLGGLYTGAVADVLDEIGLRDQCLPADIRPLEPTMKVAGPVYTVRGRARHYDDGTDPRYKQMDMLDAIIPGSVVVVDPGEEAKAAHWGELMSNTARAKGATGAVIAGGLRDTPQILEIGFPVFRRFHSPLTAVWRYDVTDFDVPVRIGGVAIAPGDFILGDVDGILVLPAAVVDQVLEEAESIREREDIVRDSLQDGGSIRELFEKYRVF
ncbi:MAG: RraA family protein [Rhodospirillales bacterium]|jgi:regulator of RNase E activity RraA|nr:RraA family protein [Rhodospirillales bacterium]MDP6883131.1 RraA family protein [Rhodospirillales bacterium]